MNPGVYVYHCATPSSRHHIANGMYGLIVVEPEGGLRPVDHEFYVMQGEIYASCVRISGGTHDSATGLSNEQPNFVVFNGRYQRAHGRARDAGEGRRERPHLLRQRRAQHGVVSFHVIGEIFDIVHKEGASEASTNIQTTLIPAGGAAWVEFTVDVPGDYILVDHSINRASGKGAIAVLHVEGPENPEIFEAL